jgi:hypothetical protein
MPLDDLRRNASDDLVETPLARRQRLIAALRNQPQPWDFRFRNACALGLAVRLGIAAAADHRAVAPAIGIGADEAWRLFMANGNRPYRTRVLRLFTRRALPTEVTPMMVADALEQLDDIEATS